MSKYNIKKETPDEIKAREEKIRRDHDFYKIVIKDEELEKIIVNRVRLVEKLKEMGFLRFDLDTDSFKFIKTDGKRLEEVSTTLITDAFCKFIEHIEPYRHERQDEHGQPYFIKVTSDMLLEKVYAGLETFFGNALLKRLNTTEKMEFCRDTKDAKYLFYQNGAVKITAKGPEFIDYDELEGVIWKNQIISREYIPGDGKPGDWEKFCFNIANRDLKREESLKTLIGYNLHNYMRGKIFATILTDSRISDDGEANGRTGKTLLGKGLGHMLNTDDKASVFIEVNGKEFDPKNKFKFSAANLDTQLIHINDLYNNYNIENSFNDITDGIQIDKKNEKPFRIFAKFILSTNKTIRIEGESARDRVKIFEFADHYSSKLSPGMEAGRWFFDDWDQQEWARFDSYNINCIVDYLNKGVIEAGTINLEAKTLADHTSREFINFMDDITSPQGLTYFEDSDETKLYPKTMHILPGEEADKKNMFNLFLKINPDYLKVKQKTFTAWVRMFCKARKILLQETRSNARDYFILIWKTGSEIETTE